ncbi:hypothetical protein JCM10213_006404 [Rhodosporidiobolus nylandii]
MPSVPALRGRVKHTYPYLRAGCTLGTSEGSGSGGRRSGTSYPRPPPYSFLETPPPSSPSDRSSSESITESVALSFSHRPSVDSGVAEILPADVAEPRAHIRVVHTGSGSESGGDGSPHRGGGWDVGEDSDGISIAPSHPPPGLSSRFSDWTPSTLSLAQDEDGDEDEGRELLEVAAAESTISFRRPQPDVLGRGAVKDLARRLASDAPAPPPAKRATYPPATVKPQA